MHVLVIDDEPAVRQILAAAASRAGYSVAQASGVVDAASKLARGDVDVALCDIYMADGDGVDLVRNTKAAGFDTHFIMITAFASVESAVESLHAGADDYVVKPIRNEELLHRLAQVEALRQLRAHNRVLRRVVSETAPRIFRSTAAAMQLCERHVDKVAPTDNTVLITGDSGTGKGVVARAIHDASRRAEAVFVRVDCAAIPANLLEAEIFGHAATASDGAAHGRNGFFIQADKGTLFLDGIGELPLQMQARLLHAIEPGEMQALGVEAGRRVDLRIIAASHRNLEQMVRDGQFREDLYYRIRMFHIHLPPLRERQADIRGLIRFFLKEFAERNGQARAVAIEAEAEAMLMAYAWPGNVRQLKNAIKRAHILGDGKRITVEDLPPEISYSPVGAHDPAGFCVAAGTLREQVRRFEAQVIARAVEESGRDRRIAAQRLGIGLSSLYRKLEEFESLGWVDKSGSDGAAAA